MPHVLIPLIQHGVGVDLVYSPRHLNGSWTHYDDIVKLFPVYNLVDNGTILGHIASPDFRDRFYVNVLAESLSSLLYWPIAAIGGRDTPFFVMPLFAGASGVALACVAWSITKDAVSALSASLLGVFGFPFIRLDLVTQWSNLASYTYRAIEQLGTAQDELNSFYRIYQNGTSYFVFVLFFWGLAKTLDEPQFSWRRVGILAAPLAALFYLYLFYGMVAGLMMTLAVTAIGPFCRSEEARRKLLMLTLAGVIAGVVALPSLLETLSFMRNASPDWLHRMGTSATPFWANRDTLAVGVVTAFCLPKGGWRLSAIALIVATLAIENAHLFFGFNIQMGHAYSRVALPLMMVVIACALVVASRRFGSIHTVIRWGLAVLALAVTSGALYFDYAYSRNTASFQGITGEQAQLIDWFKLHRAAEKPIVGTLAPDIDVALTLNAGTYSYTPFFAQTYSSVDDRQLFRRFAVMLFLSGADEDSVREFLAPTGNDLERRLIFYYFGNGIDRPEYAGNGREGLIEALMSEVKKIEGDPSDALGAFRLDYVVFKTAVGKGGMYSHKASGWLCRAAELNGYSVFRLRRSPSDSCTSST